MADTVHDFTCFVIKHVTFAAERIGKDIILSDRDDIESRRNRVGLPDQRTIFRVEAPDKSVLRVFIGAVVSTDVYASVAGTQRAFGCDIILVRQPDNVPRLRVEAGRDPVVFDG